jgi:hypothetical protein
LILVLVGMIGVFRLAWTVWPHRPALAVSLLVIPLHNLVDFSLFVSGVALPWGVLVGWGLAVGCGRRDPVRPARDGVGLVIAATVACALVVLHATSEVVERAAASNEEPEQQFTGAVRALKLAPWRVEPQFLMAAAALESGHPLVVDRAFNELRAMQWVRPRSAALAERRAQLALARGSISVAVAELWAAVEMGGADPARERHLSELLDQLEGDVGGPRD